MLVLWVRPLALELEANEHRLGRVHNVFALSYTVFSGHLPGLIWRDLRADDQGRLQCLAGVCQTLSGLPESDSLVLIAMGRRYCLEVVDDDQRDAILLDDGTNLFTQLVLWNIPAIQIDRGWFGFLDDGVGLGQVYIIGRVVSGLR